ncbi:hypothetical protein Taro_048897 [Colocasia esculenta]|uniref:Uncharacterized protein n=1 Tax=Colocasia esculenta TaxID=4460 RepID=A0A843X9E5_COLES|nr:hypothetical protein [Colocasia esculenta]
MPEVEKAPPFIEVGQRRSPSLRRFGVQAGPPPVWGGRCGHGKFSFSFLPHHCMGKFVLFIMFLTLCCGACQLAYQAENLHRDLLDVGYKIYQDKDIQRVFKYHMSIETCSIWTVFKPRKPHRDLLDVGYKIYQDRDIQRVFKYHMSIETCSIWTVFKPLDPHRNLLDVGYKIYQDRDIQRVFKYHMSIETCSIWTVFKPLDPHRDLLDVGMWREGDVGAVYDGDLPLFSTLSGTPHSILNKE